MIVREKIYLDFGRKTVPVIVYAKQNDNETREIEIVPLYKSQGYVIENGVTPRLHLTKPDGHCVFDDATLEEGHIIVKLTEQILAVEGMCIADIGLYKDEQLLSSQLFYIDADKSALNVKKIESSDEYGALKELMAAVSNLYFDDSDGKISLNDYVKKSLNIAGLPLTEDISTDALQTALKTYPVKILSSSPDESTEGKGSQLGYTINYKPETQTYKVDLYLCVNADATKGVYKWMLVNSGTLSDEQIASALAEYLEKHPISGTGADGEDGIGIEKAEINTNGELVLTYTDGNSDNVGKVVGEKGDKGDKGEQGENGKDGNDGADGFSPSIGVTEVDTGYKLSITKNADGSIVDTVTIKHGKDGADGYTPVKGVDYFTENDIEEIANSVQSTETIPSPNLVNINDTESYPFGTSETQAVKGLYSWVDSEGYINIKGTATENCTLYLMFADGNTTFEAGTYYICFDGILRAGSAGVNILFNDTVTWLQTNDASPKATITLTESLTVKKFDLNFNSGATVDFRGRCWMTKDEPIDFYVPKDGSYKVPITPIKKEDFEKLKDHNILGVFDSIGGVGDSLMSGYINPTSDDVGSDTTCYAKSWLSQIKKILGVDITHYSYQGATAKNWLENYNEFYDKIIETPHEAYLLALGTNDSSDWAGYDIGTIADMGTDTESFYGYYSKVIARIREANPKAPIFMFSMYWTGFEAYNEAIQAVSEATENAYYIDITDMDEMYSVYRQGYHFNAIGYYYIAKSIIERTSEVIVANYQDFANLGVEA